jgi:hypothetical protein
MSLFKCHNLPAIPSWKVSDCLHSQSVRHRPLHIHSHISYEDMLSCKPQPLPQHNPAISCSCDYLRCWLSTAGLLTHTIAIAWDVILLPRVYLQLLILNLIAYIRH